MNYPHNSADLMTFDDPDQLSAVELLVKRTGNGYYDPGDCFTDATALEEDGGGYEPYSSKMYAIPPDAMAFSTPEPGSGVHANEDAWYQQFWVDRYGPYGPPPDPTMPEMLAPAWPPGGTREQPSSNMPRFRQWDPDEPNPPESGGDERRWFAANRGGWWGNGGGTLDDPFDFELNGTSDAEPDVLPHEEWGYYDGPVEHDDLASSKYHQQGDQRFGEITSPNTDVDQWGDPAIAGADLGDGDPSSALFTGDGFVRAGGPYATLAPGFDGYDAGNVAMLEYLTWRTDGTSPSYGFAWEQTYGGHPYAGPGSGFTVDVAGTPEDPADDLPIGLGFRDYNLDGMIDQGEVRPAMSENYSFDSDNSTRNDGTESAYPFNRQRMMEDLVEAVDPFFDFDTFIDANALRAVTCGAGDVSFAFDPAEETFDGTFQYSKLIPTEGYVSGIILAPPEAWTDPNHFPFSPSYYHIHTDDNSDPRYMFPDWPADPFDPAETHISWNLKFHDLPMRMDGREPQPSVIAYAAHEYGHTWEGFPDTYDYDILADTGVITEINLPMGDFDLMAGARGAGAMVHFIPSMKAGLDGGCTDWIEPIDLTTILTPGVDTNVTLPPCEFIRDSYFYVENEVFEEGQRHERYWFWAAANQGMDATLPGHGMLIMHTDKGPNFDAYPSQQRHAPFGWLMVQADGQHQMEDGDDAGGPEDVWPGTTGATEFNCWTNPSSQWYNHNQCTGIEFNNVVPDDVSGAVVVTFNWTPTTIPSLRFIQPAGGDSVDGIYEVRFRSTDLYGGTWVRLFYTMDPTDFSIDPNGANYIGAYRKTYSGTNQAHTAVDWTIRDLPDGEYWVFAEMIAGPGEDGFERVMTTPRAGRDNRGNGYLDVTAADIDASTYIWGSQILSPEMGGAEGTQFTHLGVNLAEPDALTPDRHPMVGDLLSVIGSDGRSITRAITAIADDGSAIEFEGEVDPVLVGEYVITRGPGSARLESWKLECTGGNSWSVTSSLTQPEPLEGESLPDAYVAYTGVAYTSVTGNVSFTITAGDEPFHAGDMFVFVTSGITAMSHSTIITAGTVSSRPVAIIDAAPLAGEPPLLVSFDGRGSIEPQGRPLTYRWTFGDNSAASTQSTATHEYTAAGEYTAVLTVTDPDGVQDETQVDIIVYNNEPNAEFVASPDNGPVPLEVVFDASNSSDQTDDRDELTFQWDFGDGQTANAAGGVGEEFMVVQHNFITDEDGRRCDADDPCLFVVTLTVTDSGGKTDVATMEIRAGNSDPVASVFTSRTSGAEPLLIIFNAINSHDAEGDPLTVTWDFDDGSPVETHPVTGAGTATDGSVPHIYNLRAGETRSTYHPMATIRDDAGGVAVWPGINIVVTEAGESASEPRASFRIIPAAPELDEAFKVDATDSIDYPLDSGAITSYAWDFGDGSGVVAGDAAAAKVVEHTYTEPGEYVIRLVVSDNDSPVNTAQMTRTVEIEGDGTGDEDNRTPVPMISANKTSGVAGLTEFTFDATNSTDPDGDPLTYRWVLVGIEPDEYDRTAPVISYTFDEAGTYLVRLTVKDDNNAAADISMQVRVEENTGNRAPVAYIATGPRTGTVPVTLSFDGRLSSDPDGDILSFLWEVRDKDEMLLHTDDKSVLSWQFTEIGNYTVTLQVDDGRGGVVRTEPETVQVTARAVTPGGTDPDDPTDDPAENPLIDSSGQRPGNFCGLGMVMAMFGSLLGLFAMMAGRRRPIL